MMKLPYLQQFLYGRIPLRRLTVSHKLLTETRDNNAKSTDTTLATKISDMEFVKTTYNKYSSRFKEKYDIYYGKERDMVNYPPMVLPDFHPKVRMGVLPDEWFTALYNKTGVTGPYLFFWGGIIFILQKEILVLTHDAYMIPIMYLAMLGVVKIAGPHVRELYDGYLAQREWFYGVRYPDHFKKICNTMIEVAKVDKSQADVNLDLFRASKENVALQLELEYRKRLSDLYQSVKSRLDYQVDKARAKKRFQQSYMIDWIVNSVTKDFTPQHDKAMITQCIADLKRLAQSSKIVLV